MNCKENTQKEIPVFTSKWQCCCVWAASVSHGWREGSGSLTWMNPAIRQEGVISVDVHFAILVARLDWKKPGYRFSVFLSAPPSLTSFSREDHGEGRDLEQANQLTSLSLSFWRNGRRVSRLGKQPSVCFVIFLTNMCPNVGWWCRGQDKNRLGISPGHAVVLETILSPLLCCWG